MPVMNKARIAIFYPYSMLGWDDGQLKLLVLEAILNLTSFSPLVIAGNYWLHFLSVSSETFDFLNWEKVLEGGRTQMNQGNRAGI